MNRADYSGEQLKAWGPRVPDPEEWHACMNGRRTLAAKEGGEVAGFAVPDEGGHLDMLYVRKDAVGRGVGRRFYEAVELEAQGRGLGLISTEASITARPFFERWGQPTANGTLHARRGPWSVAVPNGSANVRFSSFHALPPAMTFNRVVR